MQPKTDNHVLHVISKRSEVVFNRARELGRRQISLWSLITSHLALPDGSSEPPLSKLPFILPISNSTVACGALTADTTGVTLVKMAELSEVSIATSPVVF